MVLSRKQPLRATQDVPVTQSVAKTCPHWDVDLQSVEYVGQLSLTVTPGETLRDVTILVSAQPFAARPKVVWSRKLIGAFTNSVIAEIGTAGRYIRIEAAQLALEEVDVLLPDPSAALPERVLNDALRTSDGAWSAASDHTQTSAHSSSDAQTFDVSQPAGTPYRVTFDLPGSDAGGRLFAWWNGALVAAKGFPVAGTTERHTFEVKTTGAVDKLTFRGTTAEVVADCVSIEPQAQKRAASRPVTKPVAATKSTPQSAGRTIQGVLRRSIPQPEQSRMVARKALAMLGFGENDEIIFR